MRLARLCIYERRGEQLVAPIALTLVVTETLTEIEHNLQRFTFDILDVEIDDMLLLYQRHIVEVPRPISHLLR